MTRLVDPAAAPPDHLAATGEADRAARQPALVAESAAGVGPRRWVVLGTGTGVGKSFAAVGLVRTFAACEIPAAGLKPIETGVDPDSTGAGDASQLSLASFGVALPVLHPLYSFREPLTPALAARRVNVVIELDAVRSWVEAVAARAPAAAELVIETAGGVFSPLGDGMTNFDLARALDPATWLLVAPDRLGVLHDVASCWIAMTARGRAPDCIVLSAPEQPDPSTGSNREELVRSPELPPVLTLPRGDITPLRALATRPRR